MVPENVPEMTTDTPVKSIEENFRLLEEITRTLESGDLPLEDALKTYEEGVHLVRALETQLKGTEKKLKVLTDEGTLDEF